MNKRKNEILIALAGVLGVSENPIDDIKLLSQHPAKYVAQGLHKKPELHGLTESVIVQLIKYDPSTYFYYKLHKDPSFAKYNMSAAKSLIEKEPLSAVLLYKIQREPEFDSLIKDLMDNLLSYLTEKNIGVYPDSLVAKEMKIMLRVIKKTDPQFYEKNRLEGAELQLGGPDKKDEHGVSKWEPKPKTEVGESKWDEPAIELTENDFEVEEPEAPKKPLSKRHLKIDYI